MIVVAESGTLGSLALAKWRWLIAVAAVAALAAVGLGGATAAPATTSWNSALDLSLPKDDAHDAQVAVSQDGTHMTAVWWEYEYRRKSYHVWSSSSADSGATWTLPIQLSESGEEVYGPQIAASGDGRQLTVVWYERLPKRIGPNPGQNFVINTKSSADQGATWSKITTLSDVFDEASEPQLASSNDGLTTVAVWRKTEGKRPVVQSANTTDGGLTWSAPVDLSDIGAKGFDPQVATSSDGQQVTVVWYRSDGTTFRIQVSTSADHGTTWSTPVDLSDAGQEAENPQVVMSGDGSRRTVVYEQVKGQNFLVHSRSSDDGGKTWAAAKILSQPAHDAFVPKVASSADAKNLTVVWQRSDGEDLRVQSTSSSDGGSSWSQPRNLSDDGDDAFEPDVATSTDGTRPTVVWLSHNRSGQYSLFQGVTSNDSGSTWSKGRDLSTLVPEPLDYCLPQVDVSGDGTVMAAVWERDNGKTQQIQVGIGSLKDSPSPSDSPSQSASDDPSPPADDPSQEPTADSSVDTTGEPTDQPTDRPTDQPTEVAEPTTEVQGTAKAKVKAVKARSKLRVKVKPNLGQSKQWRFVVKKKSGSKWAKQGAYRTKGSSHKLTIDLDKGKYRVKVKPRYDYLGSVSKTVKLAS